MKIHPRTGVGDIELGMDRDGARRVLGEPDRTDRLAAGDDEWIAWHYDSRRCSLYFDAEVGYLVVTVDVDHPDAELDGFRPIGATFEAVREALGELEQVEELAEGSRRAYELVGTELWFWFEDGRCDSVQVSAAWDDEDDEDD